MYEAAIKRLRDLAIQNDELCVALESGKIRFEDIISEKDHAYKVKSLISTYRYWYQCCSIAAWLLEKEDKVECTCPKFSDGTRKFPLITCEGCMRTA